MRKVAGIPERNLMRSELRRARLLRFVPFKHFYGGYLVYSLRDEGGGMRAEQERNENKVRSPKRYSPCFRQWIANYAARALHVPLAAPIG